MSQQEIEALIVRINKESFTTIIWITHNLEQAISIGDYSWVMMGGQLIEIVESSRLLYSKNERVQQFVKGDIE